MKPNPLSSLNHFTVPLAMFSSTACVLRTRRRLYGNYLRALALLCRAIDPTERPDRSSSRRSRRESGGFAPCGSRVYFGLHHGPLAFIGVRAKGVEEP